MERIGPLSLHIVLSGLDICLSFVLCFALADSHIVISLFNSYIDLAVCSIIRSLFRLIPFSLNGRVRKFPTIVHRVYTCIGLFSVMYTFIKVLLIAEGKTSDIFKPPDIMNMAFNLIASIVFLLTKKSCLTSNSEYSELEEDDEDEKESEDRASIAIVIKALLLYYKRSFWLNALRLANILLFAFGSIFIPYMISQVLASLLEQKSGDKLLKAVLMIVIPKAIVANCMALDWAILEYITDKMKVDMAADLFDSLVKQEVAFYDARKTGEISSRLNADVASVCDSANFGISNALASLMKLVVATIFMFTLSWRLAMIFVIMAPIICMASNTAGLFYEYTEEKLLDCTSKSNGVVEEVFSTMRTVRSFACEEEESRRYYEKLSDNLKQYFWHAWAASIFYWTSESFASINMLATMWYGGHLVLQHQMTSDVLLAFLFFQVFHNSVIAKMEDEYASVMQAIGAARKVVALIVREPKIEHVGTLTAPITGKVEFKNVIFSYPTRPDERILKDISFTVNPGETVALVGPSGSGKSSCISLLEQFYRPNSGEILIDSVPIQHFDYSYIHKKMALVGQEPVLFSGSVTENIRYGYPEAVETDCVKAAVLANAHGFVMDTSLQYETNVGEKGTQMSGGQKQRIAIARALVREPAILLLDEATSALDTESEQLVQDALQKNLSGRTVIVIAHRLSTVQNADRIIVINKGVIEEEGTHAELAKFRLIREVGKKADA